VFPADGADLPPEEFVSRFVYDSDKVSGTRAKPAAFLPKFEPQFERWETSVCSLARCANDERVWHLARTQRSDKSVKARIDVCVDHVQHSDLRCIAAPVPGYPEHAVIVGWPDEKHDQKARALALSKRCAVTTPP